MAKPSHKIGWTDVRAKSPIEEDIFVLAPAKKLQRLELERTPSPGDLEKLYRSVMEQELIHAGNLNFHHDPRHGNNLWWTYLGCNTPVKFKSMWQDETLEKWGIKTYFLCPQCGIRVGSRLTSDDFSRLMFHLMVKNVLPELNMCNVINASYQKWHISFSREDQDALKTGRHNPEKCKNTPPSQFRPGFIYAVHPDHCNFFSESPEWLKLLFTKYKDHMDNILKDTSRNVGGPRRK
jgi:hypothetical protein